VYRRTAAALDIVKTAISHRFRSPLYPFV